MDKEKSKPGKEFEVLTEDIFRKLSKNSRYEKIERDVKIRGKDGTRQIDIMLTIEAAGLTLKTAIECKDHGKKISVGAIDAFHSKMMDINANKGVFVSSKGFSSQAVAKAKRLGITLYTAHDANNPKWKIDVQIPIVITEIIPIDISGGWRISPDSKDIGRKFHIDSNHMCVNGINLITHVREKWNSGQLKFKLTEEEQEIDIPEIVSPFFITSPNKLTDGIEVIDFKTLFKLRIVTYLGFLDELADSKLIKDITENGKVTFFISGFPLQNYRTTFKKISRQDIPASKLSVQINSIFEIPGLNVEEFGWEGRK